LLLVSSLVACPPPFSNWVPMLACMPASIGTVPHPLYPTQAMAVWSPIDFIDPPGSFTPPTLLG
jgi:hypothetical protein